MECTLAVIVFFVLFKVFGYPRAFLMVLAKASFGRQPLPVVDHESFLQKTWALLREMEVCFTCQWFTY